LVGLSVQMVVCMSMGFDCDVQKDLLKCGNFED
jgi:hypothetical protein